MVIADGYFVMYRLGSSGNSFCRDCLEESCGMNIPVNTWFLGTELLWDGGVWNYRAFGNGISACKTSLRPELHPPGAS